MTASRREAFLERVRKAVTKGNRLGEADLPLPNDRVGHQHLGNDLVAAFCSALQRANGIPHAVPSWHDAGRLLRELVQQAGGRNIILSRGPWEDRLDLHWLICEGKWRVWQAPLPCPEPDWCGDDDDREERKRRLFEAEIGITGADWLIAETGSVVLVSRPEQPRSISLLPRVHIVLAGSDQILADLYDLFDASSPENLTANLTIITGPSKTGDIELKLVTGVHGPEQVHVIVVSEPRVPPHSEGVRPSAIAP
ncbi:MAG: lactate utilization protein [Gemmatales bacterium]|nr:lactate utilization protein [Gemmatales bacterium]MDW8387972.1 lactate utilization protein [Gemmatales bacterium]